MENVERSGMYSIYNKELEECLHDKPQVTRQCVERIASAKAIKKSDIEVRSTENLIFQVQSSSSNDIYTINQEDKTTIPQCTCKDWVIIQCLANICLCIVAIVFRKL